MLIEKSHLKKKMGFKERIATIKSVFTGVPNQSLLSMARAFTPVYGEPPKRSASDWLQMYHDSPRLNNPVHQISSDVGCATYGIYNKNDIKKIKIPNHPVEQLLKNPNPNKTITRYTLFYLIQVYLLLPNGESFVIKERNGLNKVTELWICPPSWVAEIPSVSKPYFSIFPQGNMQAGLIYVHPDDMMYFKDPDITNPYLRGMGRSNALGDDIEVDEQMVKFSKRFFYNQAVPSMVGMMPGADQETINRTEELWQQKYGGTQNAYRTAFLNWDAKLQILKETNKDLEFIEARRYIRDESNQFFNIPPELMGILESSNKSTITAAYYLYSKNVLRKRLQFIADILNSQLIPDFDNNVYLEYDQVVPEDEEFLLKKSTEGLKYGALTVNTWLRTNGFPEIGEAGEIVYTPINMIPTPVKDGAPLPTNLPPVEPPTKGLTPEHKERIWHVFDKAAVKHERSFIKALKKYFQSQQDKINKALEKSVKEATDNPDELLDWKEEEALLVIALSPLWLASMKEGYTAANVTYNLGVSFDLLNPRFLNWIDTFGAEQVKGINDTTKEKLRKTLSEGIADGESIPKLRDRTSTVFTEAKTSRAEKIARTETHSTVSNGTFETYKAGGVKKHSWLTAIDGRERPSHAAINGETVDLGTPFSNGLLFPGDPSGDASEIVNCRCVTLAAISSE